MRIEVAEKKRTVIFLMDEDDVERLDDWRFANRFASRAAAIKWLLDWALTHNPDPKATEPPESATLS